MPMRPPVPPNRQLPGGFEPNLRPIEAPVGDTAGVVSFRQALAVMRRRFQLILGVTAFGAALGLFLASREPTTYKASAMLRLAGERQTLTGDERGRVAQTLPDRRSHAVDHRAGAEPRGRGRGGGQPRPAAGEHDARVLGRGPRPGTGGSPGRRRLRRRGLPGRRSDCAARRARRERALRPAGQPRRGAVRGALAPGARDRHPRHPVPRGGDRCAPRRRCWSPGGS